MQRISTLSMEDLLRGSTPDLIPFGIIADDYLSFFDQQSNHSDCGQQCSEQSQLSTETISPAGDDFLDLDLSAPVERLDFASMPFTDDIFFDHDVIDWSLCQSPPAAAEIAPRFVTPTLQSKKRKPRDRKAYQTPHPRPSSQRQPAEHRTTHSPASKGHRSTGQICTEPKTRFPPLLPNPRQIEHLMVFDDPSDSSKPQSRKKRKYSGEKRDKVWRVREQGACLRCRTLKKSCSGNIPCDTCMTISNKRVWRGPCMRIELTALCIYGTEQWRRLIDCLTKRSNMRMANEESSIVEVRIGSRSQPIKLTLKGLDANHQAKEQHDRSNRRIFADGILPSAPTESDFSISSFDAFVDEIVKEIPNKIFVTFMATLLRRAVIYAEQTQNELLRLALRYYTYCRLTHGFLRGICYTGLSGSGIGVGVWVRELFNWDVLNAEAKAQLLRFASERVKALETKLFATIQAQLTMLKSKGDGGFVATWLTLVILVDQFDCNLHEGVWLKEPAAVLVCPRKSLLLTQVPTEQLGQALTVRATELANAAVSFAHQITDRFVPRDLVLGETKTLNADQRFLLELQDELKGPRGRIRYMSVLIAP
ncbi:MAG: hypothetical protein M1819_005436 [Sarea resinae]|nr:MAG: hypothetical protein M1819_005436 [Sarea resinae]